jgi:hypothetical protein
MKASVCGITGLVTALFLGAAGAQTAAAATLLPGEYACAGASGILIGLGFKVLANGTDYTNLNDANPGHVVYSGTDLKFVGGNLDGQAGHDLRNGGKNFEIGSVSCSHA